MKKMKKEKERNTKWREMYGGKRGRKRLSERGREGEKEGGRGRERENICWQLYYAL